MPKSGGFGNPASGIGEDWHSAVQAIKAAFSAVVLVTQRHEADHVAGLNTSGHDGVQDLVYTAQCMPSASPEELFAYLDHLGVAHQTVRHPPAFTVGDARELRGAVAGGHTKNLFLRDKKGTPYLVVALEDAAIELKSLHRLLGASGRYSFATAELMRELLGVEPGSVTPFAAINDTGCRVTVILDAALMAHAQLNFHPLANTATTTISREGLLAFLEATGHPPRIVPISAAPAAEAAPKRPA